MSANEVVPRLHGLYIDSTYASNCGTNTFLKGELNPEP